MRCIGCEDGVSIDGGAYCPKCLANPSRWVNDDPNDIYPFVVCDVCGEASPGSASAVRLLCWDCWALFREQEEYDLETTALSGW